MSDLEKIKQLRLSTGAGFKDCGTAIDEANGDLDKAAEILRIKGISKASKKMSRVAKEGVVAVSGNEKKKSLIEINCETDFVAKNDVFINFVKEVSELNDLVYSDIEKLKNSKMKNSKTVDENLVALISKMGEKITIGRSKTFNHNGSKNFNYLHTIVKDNLSKLAVLVSIETKNDSDNLKTFGKQLSMHIAASSPLAVEANSIKKEVLEKEITLISEELKGTGKPENIIKKISTGKINKFMKDNAILSQPWVMEPKKNVQDIIKELNITDLKIKDFYRLKIGE
jgi:elongation factor Ts